MNRVVILLVGEPLPQSQGVFEASRFSTRNTLDLRQPWPTIFFSADKHFHSMTLSLFTMGIKCLVVGGEWGCGMYFTTL